MQVLTRIDRGSLRPAVVELKMDEYNMDDLAGEIARTLAACQFLADAEPALEEEQVAELAK
jgi:hypothetical protein